MQGRMLLSSALMLLITMAASPLNAALIHVSMTAEVSSTDPTGPFAGASGTVTAEATFADAGVETVGYYQFYDNVGFYEMAGAPNSIAFNLGDPGEFDWLGTDVGVVQQDNLSIEVSKGHWNPARDEIYLTTRYNGEIYYMIFSGPAGSLGSDDIPDVDTLNTFYDSASIWVTGSFTSEPYWIGATATGVTFTAMDVPLPASVWLFLSGIAGLGVSLGRPRIAEPQNRGQNTVSTNIDHNQVASSHKEVDHVPQATFCFTGCTATRHTTRTQSRALLLCQ